MKIHTSRRRGPHAVTRVLGPLLVALAILLLAACESDRPPPPQLAVDIHEGDVCAVCGMYIEAGPGPRGEAYVQGYKAPLKFGSTRDLFAYALQPENRTRLQHLLVQDSARINWQHPSNEARTFVDARTASYVAWQPLSGLMGPTFASFASRKDAEAFVRTHGGEILSFSDVTPELTSMLGFGCPTRGSPAFALARACLAPEHSADSPQLAQDERPDPLHAPAVMHEIDPGLRRNRPAPLDGRKH
ncbi:nitrous oxide reductase accessory protein NosL [Rhodanobacter ginsengisoli]|uniref:nitrous oxide reductase accessory protein NosL n=1 Tax=Rhodanobacter ginsengisoli TaxID=418646 RepID=UPI00366C569A